jgi:hypothetical protein
MANLTEQPTVKYLDEVVLARPQGVYTGDNQRKHKRSTSCEMMNSGSVCEYDVKKHRRALSLQPYIRDGSVSTEVKDWTPKPLSDGTYGSNDMKDLCEEFGELAADIVKGIVEGK